MSKLTLYGSALSPPVRACMLTLKALNLPYELVAVDFVAKEHLSEEYLKKNPQHTVPTLDDGGNFLWDSHAIIAYLVDKYGKDDSLYPKDLLKRAVVNQRLHFETGVMFEGGLRSITIPLWFKNVTKFPQERLDALFEIYNFLEVFLKDTQFVAGDHVTIADLSIITTVTSFVAFADIDSLKYPKLSAWINRMKALPYYQEANGDGAEQFVAFLKSRNVTFVA